MTGLVIMSFAVFVGRILSFSVASSLLSASSSDMSLKVADAALGCPPPPRTFRISDTSTSGVWLLAIIWIFSSIITSRNTTSTSSISRILCARKAMSPIYFSLEAMAIFILISWIRCSLAEWISSLSRSIASGSSSLLIKLETIFRLAPFLRR